MWGGHAYHAPVQGCASSGWILRLVLGSLKIKAVKKFLRPQNQKHIRMFLGLCGFYRRFIKNFAHISRCLSNLLNKDTQYVWTEEREKAFELLKQKLCEAPILIYPNLNDLFILVTDASDKCLGAV